MIISLYTATPSGENSNYVSMNLNANIRLCLTGSFWRLPVTDPQIAQQGLFLTSCDFLACLNRHVVVKLVTMAQ